MKPCGTCGKCCQLLGVPNVTEAGQRCKHWCQGKGCAIYKARPIPCRNFECTWVAKPDMPESMRPDRLGIVFWYTSNLPHRLVAHIDPKSMDSWDKPEVQAIIDDWLDKEDNVVLKVVNKDAQIISNKVLTGPERMELLNG